MSVSLAVGLTAAFGLSHQLCWNRPLPIDVQAVLALILMSCFGEGASLMLRDTYVRTYFQKWKQEYPFIFRTVTFGTSVTYPFLLISRPLIDQFSVEFRFHLCCGGWVFFPPCFTFTLDSKTPIRQQTFRIKRRTTAAAELTLDTSMQSPVCWSSVAYPLSLIHSRVSRIGSSIVSVWLQTIGAANWASSSSSPYL